MHQPHGCVPVTQGPRLSTGRSKHIQPQAGAKSMDAKQVSPIGDRKYSVQVILPGNGREAGCGFRGVRALRFRNDLVLRDLMRQQVVVPNASFGVLRHRRPR